jgi:Glycosyl transferase family 11
MIVLKSNGGQLCNKIWSYVPIIAYALKYNTFLFIVDFDESISLFEDLKSLPKVYFITNKYQKKLLRLLIKFYSRFFKNLVFDINNKFLGITSCIGWEYRSEGKLISEYRQMVCKLFTPQSKYTERATQFVNDRKQAGILVGVHIRRQDYKTHINGAYFYDDDVYYQLMKSLRLEINKNTSCKVSFLICSDEKILTNHFEGLDCYQLSDAISIEDLNTLSFCDYIIGPPSTFSMWASFYGQVPLCIIASKSQEISLSQFKIVQAVDRFVDGSCFEHQTEIF